MLHRHPQQKRWFCSHASSQGTLLQAGEARTAIGSGMLQYGITPGSSIGLYSINCRGAFQTHCPSCM